MDAREVAERLNTVARVELAGPALLARLQQMERDGVLDYERISAMQGEIDAAVAELGEYVDRMRGVIARCVQLRSVPGRYVPSGF